MTPEQAQINVLRRTLNRLLREIRCGEVLYSNTALSGTVPCNYKLGVDNSTGVLYYKDENNTWQVVPNSGGSGGSGGSNTVMIYSKIGSGYTIENSTKTVTGLTDGSLTIQCDDFANAIVEVISGNVTIMPEDPSNGDTYFTKAFSSDTITLSTPLIDDNTILIFVFKGAGTSSGIQSVLAGDNITVDNTDPQNPIISASATGGVTLQSAFDNDSSANPQINAGNNSFNLAGLADTELDYTDEVSLTLKSGQVDNSGIISFKDVNGIEQLKIRGSLGSDNAIECTVGNLNFSTSTGYEQRFFTNGLQRGVITNDGNFGIATTSPDRTFQLGDGATTATFLQYLGVTGNDAVWYDYGQDSNVLRLNSDDYRILLNEGDNTNYRTIVGGTGGDYPFTIRQSGTNVGGYGVIQSGIQTSDSEVGIQFDNTGSGGRSYNIFSTNDSSGVGGGKFVIGDVTSGAAALVYYNGNFGFGNAFPGYKMTIAGDVVPDADVTYDLGKPTWRWKDLYLSGSSIHLGDITISSIGWVNGYVLTIDGSGNATFQASTGGGGTTSIETLTAGISQTVFTFTNVPASTSDYMVFRNGIYLLAGVSDITGFTVSGNNIILTETSVGDKITLHRIK